MSDPHGLGAPGAPSPAIPFARPNPIVGDTSAISFKSMSGHAGRIGSDRVTVVVDGEVVAPGSQSASALALLGIDATALDTNWSAFFMEVNNLFTSGDQYALEHQEGMGWLVEVTIRAERPTEVADLAYVDPRTAERTVTYRVRRFEPPRPMGLLGADPSSPRTSEVLTRTEPLEPSGALGVFYSGVSADDIDSTRAAAAAVEAARTQLELAVAEIDIAVTVAHAAWSGTRADVAKHKFGLEAEVIDAIAEVGRTWEAFTRELVEQQRVAKDHDEQLLRELAFEVAIVIVAGVLTWGFGAAATSAFVAGRLAMWAQRVAAVRTIITSRFADRAAQAARTGTALHAVRILARGAGDLSTRAVVAGVREDRQLTAEDWVLSFAVAGGIGHVTSEGAKALVKKLQDRHGVAFSLPGFGALKGGVQGGARAAIASPTDAALVAPLVAAVPAEAAKHTVKTRTRDRLAAMLQQDKGARRDAVERITARDPSAFTGTQRTLDDFREGSSIVDAELVRQADRLVDPVMDYTFGAGTSAVVHGAGSVGSPVPSAPLPLTGGTVPPRNGP